MKYQRKPEYIEGWPVEEILKAAEGNWAALPEPVKKAYEEGHILFACDGIHANGNWVQKDKILVLRHKAFHGWEQKYMDEDFIQLS